ncbi:eukaryotic translation initiation factor 4E-1A-like [Rhopilema esculentum]|uniref:eukaryotic translation initiation factor 4E-1A-like n=1 Tax=Rhopilema esculentum TaxID=499914 RepID=UPI0031D6DDD3
MAASGEIDETNEVTSNIQQKETTTELTQEIVTKHPLQNSWSLWFYRSDKSKSWAENLRKVITFNTVEDFWGVYNHVLLASKLQSGCDYSVFKEGIEPMWEDERNRLGGRWLINVNKGNRNAELDRLWLELLLILVGEAFGDDHDSVTGAVVQKRNKGDKIGLWTCKSDEQDSILRIGKFVKERLSLTGKNSIGYQSHLDTAGKTGSTAKNKFTL